MTETNTTTSAAITTLLNIKHHMRNGDVMNMIKAATHLNDIMESLYDDERYNDIATISLTAKEIA